MRRSAVEVNPQLIKRDIERLNEELLKMLSDEALIELYSEASYRDDMETQGKLKREILCRMRAVRVVTYDGESV